MIVNKYPLLWPEATPRTARGSRVAPRDRKTPRETVQELNDELSKSGIRLADVSHNIKLDGASADFSGVHEDPGVTVRFEKEGEEITVACDKYHCLYANLRAITKQLRLMRSACGAVVRTRSKQAVACDVLGLPAGYSVADAKRAYRLKAKTHHPDLGGRAEDFVIVQDAYARAVEACK